MEIDCHQARRRAENRSKDSSFENREFKILQTESISPNTKRNVVLASAHYKSNTD